MALPKDVKKVVLAYSGGLDTSVILKWLQTAGLTDILRTVPASHWMGDRAIYLGAFEKLRESYAVDGILRSEEVMNAWRAHSRLPNGSALARVVPEKTYTNAFALKSRVRFSA